MPDDSSIRSRIDELIATEKDLRERLAAGQIDRDEERERLRAAEVELDQCWDLLRQRQARTEFGEDPNQAGVRSEGTVEGYRQ